MGNDISSGNEDYYTGQVLPEKEDAVSDTSGNDLTSLSDEQVPLSGGTGIVGEKNSAFGSPSDCIVHWMVLLGIFISGLYFLLRCRYIRKKEILQSGFLLDTLIPMLAIPFAAAAYLYRSCRFDLIFIVFWIFVTILGMYADKKVFQKNLDEVETELMLLEQEKILN